MEPVATFVKAIPVVASSIPERLAGQPEREWSPDRLRERSGARVRRADGYRPAKSGFSRSIVMKAGLTPKEVRAGAVGRSDTYVQPAPGEFVKGV